MNSRFERRTHLDERDGAQALACLEYVVETLTCAARRAKAAKAEKVAARLENAVSSLTVARRAIHETNPAAWTRLLESRYQQQRIDEGRSPRTPIDNMGVPDEQRGENEA